MTTTTNVAQVKLNVMTTSQYNSATINASELYTVTDAKIPASDISGLATVATSGSYNDLSNKPTIPAAQVNSDWNASTGVAQILNKPSLATVATSGSYTDLSNKPTIPTVNNATLTITQGGTTKGTFTANASSNVTIDLDSGGGGASRNIGEIIQSTIPLTDAGLHLLDGSVINGAGSYSAFVTHIAGLVSGHSELFTTEANWQTSVTNYGVCGKFVYDSVNNTVRLPKITGFTEGTIDPTTLGDLTEAGLPDHRHQSWGVAGGAGWGSGGSASNGTYNTTYASEDNPIYGNSDTVQPQSIKVLYYIVIATSTKTSIEVDIDEIATDLNGKADVDLSNCTKPHIVETWHSGTSWYRIYSDGWCEQGGETTYANLTVELLKSYVNTNYSVMILAYFPSAGDYSVGASLNTSDKTTSHFLIGRHWSSASGGFIWEAKGYIR